MMRLRQLQVDRACFTRWVKSEDEVVAIPLARCARVPRATARLSALSSWQGALRPPYIPPVGRAERAKGRPWAGSIGAGLSRGRAGARAAAWALLSAVGGVRRIAGAQSFRAGRPQSAPALWRAWLTPGAYPNARSAWPGWTPGPRPPANPGRITCSLAHATAWGYCLAASCDAERSVNLKRHAGARQL